MSHSEETGPEQSTNQVTLTNARGMEVQILSRGGIISRLMAPDRNGDFENIVLGCETPDAYGESTAYLGAIVGRYANRIAGARLQIDGQEFCLQPNEGPHQIHGGPDGFCRRRWSMKPLPDRDNDAVLLKLHSPDGDQGFPGNLHVSSIYELNDKNELHLSFEATADAPTVVNLTQHSYFNLHGGSASILDHELLIPANQFTPVGEDLIPTGERLSVARTPLDFRTSIRVGDRIDADHPQLRYGQGYDHNYVLKDQHDERLVMAGRLAAPASGRVLEVFTDLPGVQFYSGNHLDGSTQGYGRVHGRHSGLCLEPQYFPNSPNESAFPAPVLRPGETWRACIVYRFGTDSVG